MHRCDRCGSEVPVYNSCLNRHCPKCQALSSESWYEARQVELLPVSYFHNVFTLPHEFNGLAWANPRVVFDLLFEAVSQVLLHFGEARLRGLLGLILLLHTWDQLLGRHLHLHCVIPSGALSFCGRRWHRPLSDRRLFDVHELGAAYRERFLELLKRAYRRGALRFPGTLARLALPEAFDEFLEAPTDKDWVVFSKPSFVRPQHVLGYLARYTHRVAISNSRLRNVTENAVTISYLDRKDEGREKEWDFVPEEFIGRFLDHVLPLKFHRIRYYGLFANRFKGQRLRQALVALGQYPDLRKPAPRPPEVWILEKAGVDITKCPHCDEGTLRFQRPFRPAAPHPHWRLVLWGLESPRGPPPTEIRGPLA